MSHRVETFGELQSESSRSPVVVGCSKPFFSLSLLPATRRLPDGMLTITTLGVSSLSKRTLIGCCPFLLAVLFELTITSLARATRIALSPECYHFALGVTGFGTSANHFSDDLKVREKARGRGWCVSKSGQTNSELCNPPRAPR